MKKNAIVDELKRINDIRSIEGIQIPIPRFCFIQRYGRTLEEQMSKILSYVNKKEWFLFPVRESYEKGDALQNLIIELQKRAKVGKEYEECVVLELIDDTIEKEDLVKVLAYLKEREDKMYFLFTMKEMKNTVSIQQCMEQYFFIRTIYAEAYTVQEQLDIIKKNCNSYQYQVAKEAENVLLEGLEQRVWEIEECVSVQLENKVSGVLYEAILEEAGAEKKLTARMAESVLDGLKKELTKKATIGFRQGGYACE